MTPEEAPDPSSGQPRVGMDIQPRVAPPPDRDPAGRSRSGAGGLISLVSKWKPLKTPKLTASLTVYVLGLFVAFVARPPVAITDEMQARYFERMEAADAIHHEQRMEAERLLLEARAETQATKDSRWFCWADAACREALSARRAAEAERLEAAMVYRRARDERVRLAKAELGLWSALGVDEAKALFRQSYERGKLFATRSSYYDTFWLILAGRSDQNLAELLIRWGFTVLSNFTVGMMSAVVNFMWALPGLISTYATSTASRRRVKIFTVPSVCARRVASLYSPAIGFFVVASTSAASVALSLLLLLYGTAGGAAYGMARAAPTLMRLEQDRARRERARLMAAHRRRHAGGAEEEHEHHD